MKKTEIKLCAVQLLAKWKNPNSRIIGSDAFCINAQSNCSLCICPKLLCSDDGKSGLVALIVKRKENVKEPLNGWRIRHVPQELKIVMIEALTQMKEKGYIESETYGLIKWLVKRGGC